ncbi:hypothetical protein AA16373_0729 [Komagataeibacter swingsii DSM 16373]|nr:hypothetical protein AA16373_0729 [Komagataeibacter swingsii DSM 16373]
MDPYLVRLFKGAEQFRVFMVTPCQHVQHIIRRPCRAGPDGCKDDEGGRGGSKGAATAACGHKGQLLKDGDPTWTGMHDGSSQEELQM